MLRRILILAVAALMAVMMTAAPAVAQPEDPDKCADAQQELAQAQEEKEIKKATLKLEEKCPSG